MNSVILVCDLGGTRLKLGVVRAGRVLAHAVEPALAKQGLAQHLPIVLATWRRLLQQLALDLTACRGISVAFPSLIDAATGRVLDAYGKYPDAADLDLREWARRELGLPLAIDNDARMACIGEWRAGAGRGVDNLVMITLGTGLGTAVVMEGKVLRGRHGQAGVLGGHVSVRVNGRRCTCGNLGCAEAEASTASLGDLAASSPSWQTSSLRQAGVLDYQSVFRHAAAGDVCARLLRDHSLSVWSTMAVNLIHAYDPEVVVLGGGIMSSADVVLPVVQEHVRRYAHTPWGKVRVVAAELGDSAALIAGDYLLAEQHPELSK